MSKTVISPSSPSSPSSPTSHTHTHTHTHTTIHMHTPPLHHHYTTTPPTHQHTNTSKSPTHNYRPEVPPPSSLFPLQFLSSSVPQFLSSSVPQFHASTSTSTSTFTFTFVLVIQYHELSLTFWERAGCSLLEVKNKSTCRYTISVLTLESTKHIFSGLFRHMHVMLT